MNEECLVEPRLLAEIDSSKPLPKIIMEKGSYDMIIKEICNDLKINFPVELCASLKLISL